MSDKEKKTFADKRILVWIGLALSAALTVVIAFLHEPFRDEAQSWMLVKENDFAGLWAGLWQEGHPMLFYLFLMPFVKAGVSYDAFRWIVPIIVIAFSAFFALKSPFKPLYTALILLTPSVLYYACWARSYCLMYILAVSVGLAWKNREKYPWLPAILLGLLAGTHAMAWGFVLILWVVLLLECRRKGRGLIVASCAFLAPAVFLCAPLLPEFTRRIHPAILVAVALIAIAGLAALVAMYPRMMKTRDKAVMELPGAPLFLAMALSFSSIAIICVLMSLTESAYLASHHFGACIYTAVGAFLVARAYTAPDSDGKVNFSPLRKIILGAFVVIAVISGSDMVRDVFGPYSRGKELASIVDTMHNEGGVVVTTHTGGVTAAVPYLTVGEIIDPIYAEPLKYTKWFDHERSWSEEVPEQEWKSTLAGWYREDRPLFILVSICSNYKDLVQWAMAVAENGEAEVVASTGNCINGGEEWKILEILFPDAFSRNASDAHIEITGDQK